MSITDQVRKAPQIGNGAGQAARTRQGLGKAPSMEDMTALWLDASVGRRIAAWQQLLGDEPEQPDSDLTVIRWQDAAKRLSVTTRCVRDAAKALGIKPVKMPGRERAIGLRERDLRLIVQGSAG